MAMSEGTAIRVLIVDDHPVVQDGLKLVVSMSPGLQLVGLTSNGEEAVELCAKLSPANLPDVILMDLLMPGMGGIEAIRRIRQAHPSVQIVALTSFAEPEQVQQALKAGAIGYLLKNVKAAALREAVRSAYARRSVMAPEATEALVQAINSNDGAQTDLSERELEILRLVAEGLTNAEIGQRLFIAESTSRFHVSNVLLKLGASNRTQAVKIALERNLIKSPSKKG
jgi:NarL family two-component system response regulator LiaR